MTKEKEEKKDTFVAGEVVKETEPAVLDTSKKPEEPDRVLSTEAALAKILNKLEDIEKAVLG